MTQRIRSEALFEDFTALIPQDGSVEIVQNYVLHSDKNIRIGSLPPPGRVVLKLERFHADADGRPIDSPEAAPTLNLVPGEFLRIQCLHGYQTRHILRVTPVLGGGIITLRDALNDDPTPGGEIRRIQGKSQHYIDYRIYDLVEKGKLHAVGGRYYKIGEGYSI